ncbi:MAG TPA: helix-turn-helix domain-containing protein [Streptosporangiaceae bacterium]|nr:helix-turn-helix domain-containing protein [Streptosporangiaceae bacterium]
MLELLASDASQEQISLRLSAASPVAADDEHPEEVYRARQLGLRICTQLDQARRREGRLHFLIDTAVELATHCDLDSILQAITRRTRLLIGVDMAFVCLRDEESIRIRAADGHVTATTIGLPLPESGTIGATVLRDNAPFWTADYLGDERIKHNEEIDESARAEGLHAVLTVPLIRPHGRRPDGVLYAADRKVRNFTADEVGFVRSLALLAGAAIERAQRIDQDGTKIAALEATVARHETKLARFRELTAVRERVARVLLRGCDMETLGREASRELGTTVRIRTSGANVAFAVGDVPELDEKNIELTSTQVSTAARSTWLDNGLYVVPFLTDCPDAGRFLAYSHRAISADEEQRLRPFAEGAALLHGQAHETVIESEIRDELLDDLLAIPQRPREQILRRARRLGVDLSRPHVVLIAHPEDQTRSRTATCATSYARRVNGLKTMHDEKAVLLVPAADGADAALAAGRELSLMLGCRVTVGASDPVTEPQLVPAKYQEALRCVDALLALGAIGRTASPRELGFAGFLLSDNYDAEEFIDSVLGPILELDRERSSDLIDTLEAYFDSGGSPTRAANQLYLHPNTVARRIDRISELLGPAWQDGCGALEIHLAARLYRIRNALPESRTPSTDGQPGPAQSAAGR